ncbi:hypothetical protein [Butyrivibrio sp. M55]|uniref:hypothetical protein n=1 Tax=Butyrivibrio sp. M55 TaxID=1855323 RepID=UPI0008EE06BD|nr:hypothetical protein [Butyrivibrio sp. M55]SFU90837.1 pilus assembly protein CpaF [Butyrivibrio sp. M55]
MDERHERIAAENKMAEERHYSGIYKKPVPLISPEECYINTNNNIIPILFSKWTVYGFLSFLVTGDQGCGKSTYLKSIARFYPPSAALRVSELQPELNLRFAYPNRNILAFAETGSVSVQDGLDFQKKTSGTVNIIGEIATAPAASWYSQTCKVASRSGAGTHHAKTVPDLITAFAMNMMSVAGYNNEKSVEVMVADAIDVDIHMARDRGDRFCERITEISAIKQEAYPFPDITRAKFENAVVEPEKAALVNEQEYYKRVTDRATFSYHNLCEFDRKTKTYEFVSMFSDEFIKRILANIPADEEKLFVQDMNAILKVAGKGKLL